MTKFIKKISFLFLIISTFSCEHERLEPVLTTAEGGGTLTKFIAYTIESVDAGTDIYGRVVFWEDTAGQTLVQVSVYNTVAGEMYPTSIMMGDIGMETSTMLDLYDVSGDSGELSDTKFYAITDTSFYDTVPTMDSHINVYSGTTIVAAGSLGINAEPVESN
ncbi:hypothetical protein GGR42_002140 [Saonia flava]|uniref:Uncharacterized protein n=1 Tax=Saonia flava TaxID=523696 RepID=A0A846QUG2_9FLAO|nr:hypothetical protein [Saonia flava]NJB71678.1 hypothetical protein [Saonia flava]